MVKLTRPRRGKIIRGKGAKPEPIWMETLAMLAKKALNSNVTRPFIDSMANDIKNKVMGSGIVKKRRKRH
jgi:hypothetical protein